MGYVKSTNVDSVCLSHDPVQTPPSISTHLAPPAALSLKETPRPPYYLEMVLPGDGLTRPNQVQRLPCGISSQSTGIVEPGMGWGPEVHSFSPVD